MNKKNIGVKATVIITLLIFVFAALIVVFAALIVVLSQKNEPGAEKILTESPSKSLHGSLLFLVGSQDLSTFKQFKSSGN